MRPEDEEVMSPEAQPPVVQIDAPTLEREDVAHQLAHNAGLTTERALEATDLLIGLGIVVEGVPCARTLLSDAQTFAERTILAELVVRLFRFYILGNVVLPDSPLAMDWLKSFIDGTGHGPLGAGPLRWPRMVPSACKLMETWGFEPTKSDPPYVIKRRG